MEDNIVAEEVIPPNPTEGAQPQRKNEFPIEPDNIALECQEMGIPGDGDYSMRIPVEGDYSPSSRQEFLEMNRVSELEHPYYSIINSFMDDAMVEVEGLTVKNYNNSKSPVLDTSNNHGRMQSRQSPWQHLYQLPSGSGIGSSLVNIPFRDNQQGMSSGLENRGSTSFPEFLTQKAFSGNHYEAVEELTNTENGGVSGNNYTGIRTKILSKSSFSEFFVKNTLKGKGVIFRGPRQENCHVESRNLNSTKVAIGSVEASDPTPSLDANNVMPSSNGVNPRHENCHVESRNLNGRKVASGSMEASDPTLILDANFVMSSSNGLNTGPKPGSSDQDGISLREWLKIGHPKANKVECLHIFRQIVGVVDHFHSQGVALHGLRPSFFMLFPSYHVKYVGLPIQKEMLKSIMDQDISHSESRSISKNPFELEFPSIGSCAKKQKVSQNTRSQWPQFPTASYFKREIVNTNHINIYGLQNISDAFDERNSCIEHETRTKSSSPHIHSSARHLTSISEQLEEKWYLSPEERSEGSCTVLSNIYNLGVLLFELLSHFDSNSALDAAMSDLRYRVLPPHILSKNAKEAGFCLWLLHPEPSSRPTTREILQSEVVNALEEVCVEKLLSSVDQEDTELEVLLHFLTSLKEQKQKDATKLMETIKFLEEDAEEVERRFCSRKPSNDSGLNNKSLRGRKDTFISKEHSRSEVLSILAPVLSSNESRFKRNIDQIESVYFSMRSRIQLPETDSTVCTNKDLLKNRNTTKDEENETSTGRLGAIFDGLCKYARYSKFEVRGILRNGDFNSSSNLISSNIISSLSFDRDEDYFAAAGVSRKIKIFEFNAFLNDSVDIHYPVIEMSNKSKISCICWNPYIKNYLASTDFDGIVKLWDASTGQEFAQFTEHERKAYSVDFSQLYPTTLATGSDDGSVKLWSINEKNSLNTIITKRYVPVCCVQFSAHSTHLLAFGSADNKTYCYDLRNTKTPWCVLTGHNKAVSCVKFLDSETLVSASTDNTLKLWDLNKISLSGPSTKACSLTFSGHTNEKNFVGLSVSDGYIACGSETNEVYAYYRSLPMPITSHKFGSIDPISGKDTDADNVLFVSSVCWRGKSGMMVVGNSSGCMKVLQMV